MDAKIIRFSDSETGEDLAILMVRKHGFVDVSAEFYLDNEIPPIGTHLFHVGSLLGQMGANSMTDGIVSQHGRVLQLQRGEGVVFDQTTANAFPGSSGGGVFVGNNTGGMETQRGKYMGMLVRGAGETFNLIVPVRRLQSWTTTVKAAWVLDPSLAAPTVAEVLKSNPEDIGIDFSTPEEQEENNKKYGLRFLIEDIHKIQPIKPIRGEMQN